MESKEISQKWGHNFRLRDFSVPGSLFPIDRYPISKSFLLVKDPEHPEAAIACIGILYQGKKMDALFETIGISEKHIFNFAALYSLFSPLPLRIEHGQVGYSIRGFSELGGNLSMANWKWEVTLTSERQENEKKFILDRLENSSLIWDFFNKMPENSLKKNITNSLHYFYYGKNAVRIEEKIVNFVIGFECLFLESERELGYKLSHRSSLLLSYYIEKDRNILYSFIKNMYDERSSVVHSGEIKKTITQEQLIDLEFYLSICIRSYMIFSKNFNNKQKVINYIERGILGEKIKIPSKQEINFQKV